MKSVSPGNTVRGREGYPAQKTNRPTHGNLDARSVVSGPEKCLGKFRYRVGTGCRLRLVMIRSIMP